MTACPRMASVVAGCAQATAALDGEPRRLRPVPPPPPAPADRRTRALAAARLAVAYLAAAEPDEQAALAALELAAGELL